MLCIGCDCGASEVVTMAIMKDIPLQVKRIYDESRSDDGLRALVDRLWPRGMRKEEAHIDVWLKDVAPSPALRTWFGHVGERFPEFRAAYEIELATNQCCIQAVNQIIQWLNQGSVTLLYAAKDPICNHAVVLYDVVIARCRLSESCRTKYP